MAGDMSELRRRVAELEAAKDALAPIRNKVLSIGPVEFQYPTDAVFLMVTLSQHQWKAIYKWAKEESDG